MLWSAIARTLLQAVQLVGTVVLARLLVPSEHGLVAIVNVVNGFAGLIADLGVVGAIVQTKRLSEPLLSTALTIVVVFGLSLTFSTALAAAPLSAFFDEPALRPLLLVASLNFSVSLGTVHFGLLQRAMQFRAIGIVELSAAGAGLVVSIACARSGVGAMSLVVGPLAANALTAVLLWRIVPWRPTAKPTGQAARELWGFGGGLTGFNIVNYWSRNLDNVLLGKVVSATDLGLYGKAYSIMMFPLSAVGSVVTRVTFPALAEMGVDDARFRRAWLLTVRTILALGLPIGLGVAVTSRAAVEVVFGPRWLGMSTVLTLLAASVPPQLVGRTLGPALQARGRTGTLFRIGVLTTIITAIMIVVGLPWGIEGVAAALCVTSWVTAFGTTVPVLRMTGTSARQFVAAIRNQLAAGGLLVAAATAPPALIDAPAGRTLVLQLAAGAAAYIACLTVLDRELCREVLQRMRREPQ